MRQSQSVKGQCYPFSLALLLMQCGFYLSMLPNKQTTLSLQHVGSTAGGAREGNLPDDPTQHWTQHGVAGGLGGWGQLRSCFNSRYGMAAVIKKPCSAAVIKKSLRRMVKLAM